MGDFDAAVEALSPLATPMEVQGLFCGVYCVSKATPTQAHWHEMLRTHFGDEAPLVDAVDAIAGAQGQALADENLSFQLWLPDDEAPLGDRADGLARFCGVNQILLLRPKDFPPPHTLRRYLALLPALL